MRRGVLLLCLLVVFGQAVRPAAENSSPAAPIPLESQFNFGISAEDAEKTAQWYEGSLGLTRVKTGTFPGGKFIILGSPRVSVEIIQQDSAVDARKQLNIDHDYLLHGFFKIGLYVKDLDATIARLKRTNVRIHLERGTDEQLRLRFAIIHDNEGNTIQLFETAPIVAPSVPTGIEKLHQDDVAATLTRDLDALTALWDEDGVLLQPGEPPVTGKTAFREFLKQNLAKSSSTKILKYAPEIRDLRIEGDVAYEWGFFESTVQLSDHEQPSNLRARFVRVLRRQSDGTWRFSRVMWAPE